MPKRYEIEKITDIFAIPEDKFDDFLVDFKAYHQFGRGLSPLLEELAKTGGIEATVVPQKMTWIDDGEHNATITLAPQQKEKIVYINTAAPRAGDGITKGV